jgi:hypothetical protein
MHVSRVCVCVCVDNTSKAQGVERSKVASSNTDTLSEVRTSSGLFMSGNSDRLLSIVERRYVSCDTKHLLISLLILSCCYSIANWTMLPVAHGEAFYFLQYEENQQYLPHNDYFDPTLPGMDRYLGTCMLSDYLIYTGIIDPRLTQLTRE